MAINVGDIFRIVSCGNIFEQQTCNVFYYLVALWTGNATLNDVAVQFSTDVLTPMAGYQADDFTWTGVSVENVTSGLEFNEQALNIAGSNTQEPLSSFTAFGVRYPRTSKATRSGYKRFPGFTESYVVGNTVTMTALQAEGAFAATFAPLTDGTDFTLTPIILGRNSDGSLDLSRYQEINGMSFPKLTTQNTRKAGRGS